MVDLQPFLLQDTSLPLYHYSSQPLKRSELGYCRQSVHHKPHGLWLSYDEDGCGWADWCRVEGFRLWALSRKAKVDLKPGARLFHVPSLKEEQGRKAVEVLNSIVGGPTFFYWENLVGILDGLIITGYSFGPERLDAPVWYYTMDCDCACVWNHRAISKITHVT